MSERDRQNHAGDIIMIGLGTVINTGAIVLGGVTGHFTGKGEFEIDAVSGNWGRLKSGEGWISLDYTTRI